ncbi:hypothetical protein Tco_1088068 [Tanacetum coccineum]
MQRGSVTFGGSKGYITGKGMIRVGNLEFDSVSFVKELGHFNLFSISQICDKQHKVLFTETECLVVSPDFKMPDEHQILLKVPRQHNMYSFDMKTPAPTKDYACLIAKATSDESKLWHRRSTFQDKERQCLKKKLSLKGRRNRPMTQAEQREYMIKYLKSQGNNWKMSQLKKVKPDELKEEFDKCVEKVEKFIPMNSELEASKLKRTSINIQAEVSKKQKITDVPDVTKDESVKREEEFKVQQPILRYNKRKYLARKGMQKNKSESARSDTKEDVEAYMDERVDEPSSEEFQMGSIPQRSAPAKIFKWQILKTCKKGAYQIIKEDHRDVVYVNFQGLLNDLTRDDLKELYRLMMLKYGDSRPEEEYKRVLSWRYFPSCAVHCLTLEDAHIYMLTEVKYPLPSRVCQAMLEKRLIGDRKYELANKLYGYQLTISVFVKSWLAHKIMACGKGCGKSIYMVDSLPKTGWYSTYQ